VVSTWARHRGAGYLLAVGLVALITAGIGLIPTALRLEHRSPVYLVAVLATGALVGRGPAILAAVLSFVAFDWFFVQPAHTLHVADPDEWQALLLFLLAAVVTGHLTALLRERAEVANRRERETVLLYEVGKALAGGGAVEASLATATERLRAGLGLERCDVLLGDGGRLEPLTGPPLDRNDQAAAMWVFAHASPAWRGESGGGTGGATDLPPGGEARAESRVARRLVRVRDRAGDRLLMSPVPRPPSAGAAFLPLVVQGRPVGVLYAVRSPRGGPVAPGEEARLLASACDQLALAVERGRLQRETVQAEVLRRTDALRAALLSSVSHDLRSPLAAIKAAAGSLLQRDVTWDDGTRLAFTAQIEREADRLDRLVGNLLDLSRIEAGALVLDRQWYPLGELVDDTVARLGPVLANHRVQTAVPESLPPVLLDYLLIQQVLVNLIENAAKYSPPGTRIRISAATAGTQHVRLRVEDEGPGLPLAERERIFERFYRVRPPHPQPEPDAPGAPSAPAGVRGMGLGLAVCTGFVAAHGGRIWVEPAGGEADQAPHPAEGQAEEQGRGAAFVFELPLTAPPAAPPALPPGEPEGANAPAEQEHTPSGEAVTAAPAPSAKATEVYRRPRTRRTARKASLGRGGG
jgi:two-component system sensor histidine kinase KdpD